MNSLSFCLSDIEKGESSLTRRVVLPLGAISVLTQVRKSMDVSEDLIPSILEHGQQSPGIAAALQNKSAHEYIDQVNAIWQKAHRLKDQTKVVLDGKHYYIFLVAGHRRHHACSLINKGFEEHVYQESAYYNGLYLVDLRFGLSAKEAISIQFNENRHKQVPSHEEAKAAWDFYRWLKRENSSLTISEFARIIGRTPGWVRGALRFCSLPYSVQDYADGTNGKPKLPYGILIHLARLGEKMAEIMNQDFPEDEYQRWIHQAMIEGLDVVTFGKLVSEYLDTKTKESRGQFSLFGSADIEDDFRPIRKIFAEEMQRTLMLKVSWIIALKKEFDLGGFGDETILSTLTSEELGDLYSPGSPIRNMARILSLFDELLPDIIDLAAREGGRYRPSLVAGKETISNCTKAVQEVLNLKK